MHTSGVNERPFDNHSELLAKCLQGAAYIFFALHICVTLDYSESNSIHVSYACVYFMLLFVALLTRA